MSDIISRISLETKVTESNEGSFLGSLIGLKNKGKELLTGYKTKIYMLKYIFLDLDLEVQACR